ESSRNKKIKKLKNGLNKKLKSDVPANKTEVINISDGEIISGTQSKLKKKKKKGKPILKKKKEQENTKANQKKRVSFSEPNEGEEPVEGEVEEKGVANCSGEEYHEDIYGRLRDKEGKIVSAPEVASKETNGKYIPPAMRKLMELNNDEKKKEQLAALQRRLKGLLNRLAESNIAGIVSQIEAFYKTNSRNDMDESITKLLFEMLVTPILTPERLCQEYALLIAVLTANVGPEVGAHILTEFVLKWVEELESFQPATSNKEIESKELDNKLMFVCHLYNFKVIDATLVYDLLHKILERDLGAKEVELILLVLRSVGFTLRKDDPLRLKRFITEIQAKSSDGAAPESDPSYSRLQFMLEVLTAIKNNNISKVPNYDPTHTQHLKTAMKGLVRKGCRTSDLKISLEDLVKSKVVGKWWVVGSAWSGGLKEEMNPSQENQAAKLAPVESSFPLHNFSDDFKKKAAKLQMNRPPRINILYAITEGSDSPDEACEKLIQLKLPPSQEREICSVMIQCCMRAKEHTPFHALLALKLCKFKKAFSRLFQFTLWDQFNMLDDMKAARAANLAKFAAHLIAEDCLHLSLFKTLDFAEADKKMVSFLRQSLIALLLNPTGIYAVTRAFNHLSSSPKLNVLRQYIRLFILKFINPKDTEEKDMKVLQSRIKLALDTLSSIGG
ncbi:UNVERIFIED_CONTAM: hypothetical protein GTU68_015473, partial [Idotea baltica]|nr:hypothetical protein [Idotea baltica]